MTTATYYWHDYETFGINPQRDRACQFAGIRTDMDFNVISEPLMLYCKTAEDYLPNPEACLITGITPQLCNEKGICEAEFIRIIHEELAQPGTCGIGYNSIRFDDEVTRNLLYRNFYDPYAREWQNGNSRWDLIDVARAARALRPDGIQWPVNEEGVATFRLEVLTQANDIVHQAAHDALSDVYATIALAKLIKQRQPKLFNYLSENRYKAKASQLLQLGSFTPLVHISGRFAAKKNCLAIIVPICLHPTNNNEVIVYDLSVDPSALLTLDAANIQQRVFVANDALAEGVERIPLKTIHINKSPVLAPLSVIRSADEERLGIDLAQCKIHLQHIQAASGLTQKLAEVFNRTYSESPTDPDLMIYSGGFFSQKDKAALNKIRQASPQKLTDLRFEFEDTRIQEMLFRFRGRNYPETLNTEEKQNWRAFCRQRLMDSEGEGSLSWFKNMLAQLHNHPQANQQLLKQLQDYADAIQTVIAAT